jgi:hypothetical protein
MTARLSWNQRKARAHKFRLRAIALALRQLGCALSRLRFADRAYSFASTLSAADFPLRIESSME